MKELNKKLVFACLFLLILPLLSMGQNRQNLEKRRKQLFGDISRTENLLEENAKNKSLIYEQYLTIEKQIYNRNELMLVIQKEIESYNVSLGRTEGVITALKGDIVRLKADYQQLIKAAYKRKLAKTDLLFLFSSKSFNQAYKRWQYLKQYDKYRKKQAVRIIETQKSLEQKIKQQGERKVEKENLLKSEKEQLSLLQKELKTKDKLLAKLRANDSALKQKIKQKKREHEKLNIAIENAIEKNIKQNRRKNRVVSTRKTSARPSSSSPSLSQMRGKLPWPAKGVVSSRFGKQNHSRFKDVFVNNTGIDILLQKQTPIKAIATGKVVAANFVHGTGFLIVLEHGEYYSLYSRLGKCFVKTGDFIQQGSEIGIIGTNPNTEVTELHFEIWHIRKKMNPLSWLKRES